MAPNVRVIEHFGLAVFPEPPRATALGRKWSLEDSCSGYAIAMLSQLLSFVNRLALPSD